MAQEITFFNMAEIGGRYPVSLVVGNEKFVFGIHSNACWGAQARGEWCEGSVRAPFHDPAPITESGTHLMRIAIGGRLVIGSRGQARGKEQIPFRVDTGPVGEFVILTGKSKSILVSGVEVGHSIAVGILKKGKLGLLHHVNTASVGSHADPDRFMKTFGEEGPLVVLESPDASGAVGNIDRAVLGEIDIGRFESNRNALFRYWDFPYGIAVGDSRRVFAAVKGNGEFLLVWVEIFDQIALVLLPIRGQTAEVRLLDPIVKVFVCRITGLQGEVQVLLRFRYDFQMFFRLPVDLRFSVSHSIAEMHLAIPNRVSLPAKFEFPERSFAERPRVVSKQKALKFRFVVFKFAIFVHLAETTRPNCLNGIGVGIIKVMNPISRTHCQQRRFVEPFRTCFSDDQTLSDDKLAIIRQLKGSLPIIVLPPPNGRHKTEDPKDEMTKFGIQS